MPTFVSDTNDGLFAFHMGFPGPLAWTTLCKDNSSLHMGCVLRCECRTLPLTSSRCLPSRVCGRCAWKLRQVKRWASHHSSLCAPCTVSLPELPRVLPSEAVSFWGPDESTNPTLTWDWPVTGVPLFTCSIPFSPSLYNVTVCQAPSLILVSLTMAAIPVPQLNLAEGREWRGRF